MRNFNDYYADVLAALTDISLPDNIPTLYDPITYTLEGGGKRLRPVMLLMACDAIGGDTELAKKAAAGIETFHNFTLLHDDVMDKSDMRRGRKTVHIRWDENSAILSGDAMLTLATQLISEVPDTALRSVLDAFNFGAMAVYEGQALDMEFEKADKCVELHQYIQMITLKTGALLGTASKIGALIGNASPIVADAFYNFGLLLGIAFQIHDDYLDMYGNSETLGKPIGGDVQNNKQTFLLLSALAIGGDDNRKQLLNAMKMVGGDEKLSLFRNIYNSLDLAAVCKDAVTDYCNRAIKALDIPAIPEEGRLAFAKLVNRLIDREK